MNKTEKIIEMLEKQINNLSDFIQTENSEMFEIMELDDDKQSYIIKNKVSDDWCELVSKEKLEVAYNGDKIFKISNANINLEDVELEGIDYGMEDIGDDEDGNIIVRTNFSDFGTMSDFLEQKKIEVISAETIYLPSTTVSLEEEQANEVLQLVAKIEEDDDVQKVYHNLS